MTDVDRWWWDTDYDGARLADDGPFVLYADHVEALAQAEQRGLQRGIASKAVKKSRIVPSASASMATPLADKVNEYQRGYEKGQRDALAAAVQRVEAIVVQSRWGTTSHGLIGKGEALAAIKGEQA